MIYLLIFLAVRLILKRKALYCDILISAAFISLNEGFKPCAYYDHSRYSIGYGTIAKKGEKLDPFCRETPEAKKQAATRMINHLKKDYENILSISTNFKQEELDFLLDHTYNAGFDKDITILVKQKQYKKAKELAIKRVKSKRCSVESGLLARVERRYRRLLNAEYQYEKKLRLNTFIALAQLVREKPKKLVAMYQEYF
jgi:GH24 family phage-related lysozyme (muramidase)